MTYQPLPEYIRSNVSKEELLAILKPCMSPEVYRLIERAVDGKPLS